MATFEHHILRLGSARIHYLCGGSGEPLVLVHGLSGSSRWWGRNVQPLARRFRVYVIDLIGYGGSRGQPFVLREAADLLYRMLRALEIERANLMGHSMGGFIVASMAAQHPETVDRLVLVDALAVPVGHSVIASAVGLVKAIRYMPFSFLPVLLTDALRAGPLTLLRSTLDIHKADLTADLSRIEARIMIVWGEKDTLLTLARGEALHRALPKAEYVVVKGAGHNPMWDKADTFNQIVMGFLGKV